MDFQQQQLLMQQMQFQQMQQQQLAMMSAGLPLHSPMGMMAPHATAAAVSPSMPNNQNLFFPTSAPAPPAVAAAAASTPPAHAAAASYPAAAASSSSGRVPSASSRRTSTAKSTTGPRELQVVWQGEWDPPAPMDMDDDHDRDGAKADPRMNSRELRLTASTLAELMQLVHKHFPTRPDRPVQLTDDQQKPITSESDFASLSAGDVVLGFDAPERRITFTWSKSFQHIPHPSIVTYSQELIAAESSGAPHAIVAYALAEFIDNSISALRKYRTRYDPNHNGEIRVSFMEHRNTVGGRKQWSIGIGDDGCGMDSGTIHAFSRMGDAPQYRNEAREDTVADARNHFLNVNISQWGVGAKSAGFYLGNCITVTSRQPRLQQVLQCAMSQTKMFEDHLQMGNAFNDQLVHRAIGDLDACKKAFPTASSSAQAQQQQQPPALHSYLEHLVRSEHSQAHFTRIVVTGIEQRHLGKLSDVRGIARELANVYNRFLHGPMGLNAGVANFDKAWFSPRIVVEHCLEVEPPAPGAGAGAASWRRSFEQDLSQCRDNDAALYQLRRQGPTLRFKMQLDAPLADTHSAEQSRDKNRAIVMGELFYLPKGVDGESHPVLQRKEMAQLQALQDEDEDSPAAAAQQQRQTHKRPRVAGASAMAALAPTPGAVTAAAASAAAAAAAAARPSEHLQDSEGNLILSSEHHPVFDVYWHGRLIPFAHVDLLPFMKFKPETRDCLSRMHGALFFSFPFLTSRNKLSMAERDLEGFLSRQLAAEREREHAQLQALVEPLDENGNPPTGTSSRGKNIEKRWKEVLETQWKALDANYFWDPAHRLNAECLKHGKELYSQVSLTGSGSAPLVRGGLYKVWKTAAKGSKPVWLRARYFEQETTTGAGGGVALVVGASGSVGSVGKIWGDVMPKEAQLGIKVMSLRLIDKETPPEEQAQEYAEHVSLCRAGVPEHIEVWMEPRDMLAEGTTRLGKSADYSFPPTAVAVWGHPHRGAPKPLANEKVVCRVVRFDDEGPAAAATAAAADAKLRAAGKKQLRPARAQLSDSDSGSDDEKQSASAAGAARSRTARPKKLRRAGAGGDSAAVSMDVSDEESSEDDGVRQLPGRTRCFWFDTDCMTKDVALEVRHGAMVQRAAAEPSGAGGGAGDAAHAAGTVGKKRKDRGNQLGANGFVAYEFDKHKCGHYRISFFLAPWATSDGRRLTRKFVPRVHADIVLTPALPVHVALDRVCINAGRLDMGLGQTLEEAQQQQLQHQQHASAAAAGGAGKAQCVGFSLEDSWKNAWNESNLRGKMGLCGIRVASVTAVIVGAERQGPAWADCSARLQASCKPELVWRPEQKHWGLEQLRLFLEEGDSLPFDNAASRIDVQLSVRFDVQAEYAFDPAPSPAALAKLRQAESHFTVRLGPGEATHFVCNEVPPQVTLVNGDSHAGLAVHLEDAWHHPTAASEGMQMQLAASVPFVPDSPLYSFDPAGRIRFEPVRVDIPADVFAAHCQPADDTDGALVVRFDLRVNLVFKDAPPGEVHQVKSMQVTVRPRWGPVRLLLLRGDSHLRRKDEKLLAETDLAPLKLDGVAGQDVDGLYVAFMRETGQLLPVDEVKSFLGHRAPQLHFYLDGLDGAANHFTLRELDSTGRIQQRDPMGALPPSPGLSFSKLLVASRAETDQPASPDGSLLFRGNFHLKIIDDSPSTSGSADGDSDAADADVLVDESRSAAALSAKAELRSAAALSAKAETRAKLERLPKLRSLLQFSTLSTPFYMRLRPGPAVRWSVAANFPRGFKCGLMWQEHVRMCLVDRYGNQALVPQQSVAQDQGQDQGANKLAVLVNVHHSSPLALDQPMDSPMAETTTDANSAATAAAAVVSAEPAAASSVSAPVSMEVDSGITVAPGTTVAGPSPASAAAAAVTADAAVPAAPAIAAAAPAPTVSSTLLLPSPLRNLAPTRPLQSDGTLSGHWVSPTAFMVAPAGSYWLVVRDSAGRWDASDPVLVQLVPGVAQRLRVYSDPLCTREIGFWGGDAPPPHPRASCPPAMAVQSKCRVERLWVRYYDRGGNETHQPAHQVVEMRLALGTRTGGAAGAGAGVGPAAGAGVKEPLKGEGVAAASAGQSPAAPSSAAAASSSDASTAKMPPPPVFASSDPTVSGLYDYPLRRASSSSASSSSAPGGLHPQVKDEYTPLSNLVGFAKKNATDAASPHASAAAAAAASSTHGGTAPTVIVLQEFTLHLNVCDWTRASLVVQTRDLHPKPGQGKGPLRHGVLIPLVVSPFRQQVARVQLRPVFPAEAMAAALRAAPDQLSLRPHLLVPPAAVTPAEAATAAAAGHPVILPPVPAGTPFPSIYVDLIMDEASGTVKGVQASSGDGSQPESSGGSGAGTGAGAVVKLEPGMEDERVYHAGFLLPGLSIEVVFNPSGATSRRQGDVYQPARFDHVRKKFVFRPVQVEELAALAASSLAPRAEDYVFDQTGPWLFLVRYLEPREAVANVLAPRDLERVAQLLQPVVAGQPRALRLVPGCVDTSIVVGNLADTPPQSRTVASRLMLDLVDAFGHHVEFGSLAPESVAALQQLQWKLEPATRASAAAAASSAHAGHRSSSASSSLSSAAQQQSAMVIDLIDSDTEEEKGGAGASATASVSSSLAVGSAASSAPAASPPAPPTLTPPQLHIDPPLFNATASRLEFGAITVVAGTAGDSGRYTLRLSLPAPFGLQYRASLSFQFTNDVLELQHHQEAARRRKAQLQLADGRYTAKLQQLCNAQREGKELDAQLDEIKARQAKVAEQMARVCRDLSNSAQIQVPAADARALPLLLRHLDERQRELAPLAHPQQRSDGIPAKLPRLLSMPSNPMARLSKAQGYHGALVQLAFVEDFKLAVLISWFMESHLQTLITSDRGSVGDREVRQWCGAQRVGAVIDLRGVSQSSFDPAVLPHQRRPDPSPSPPAVRGNPRYLLNCLRLHTSNPVERAQYTNLFSSLVGATLIMDSMDEASAYRHYCVQRGVRPPAILCLRELKLLSANNVERFDDKATARGLQYLATHLEVRPPADGSTARAQTQLQAVQTALPQLRALQHEQSAVDAAAIKLDHPTRSHRLAVQLTDLQREAGAMAAEVRRLGGDASDRLVAEAPPTASGAGGAQGGGSGGSGAGSSGGMGTGAQSRLSQQHGQHEQDRRRAQNARLVAMQEEDRRAASAASAAAAAAAGVGAASSSRPLLGNGTGAPRFFPSTASARSPALPSNYSGPY